MFGADPTYDAVASYTITWLIMKGLQNAFKVNLNMIADANLLSGTSYDLVKRNFQILSEPITLYGPVSFDATLQRNVGRSPAASQFHKLSNEDADGSLLDDKCIAPLDVASGSLIYPSPGSQTCVDSYTAVHVSSKCLLCDKCEPCSDIFTYSIGQCDRNSERLIVYHFLSSQLCTAGISTPPARKVECEYVPVSSVKGRTVIILCIVNMSLSFLLSVGLFIGQRDSTWQALSLFGRLLECLGLISILIMTLGVMLYVGEPSTSSCQCKLSIGK